MKHRDIQPAHEIAVLESFKIFLSKEGCDLKVLSRPDPPDAIVDIDGNTTWIEISDAFQNSEWARSITTYAADDKVHIPGGNGLTLNPDEASINIVTKVILNKYDKKTMNSIMAQHGPGILLVGMYTPMTFPEDVIEQAGHEILEVISSRKQIFGAIYLYRNSFGSHLFYKLL
ncbi:hypothetical protein AGRI_01730 [Alishewanella agri BL06]|uniref:Uncharacterized protein n=1 Tax=Alishewanella agri BL06 TaxID=1195246 RepID=I9P6L9_9ALTE|nr:MULTISPECIES: hypothetical protein [Alishewanella]EIW90549.1 hypothetical protein AGRI_01730 [Alishewanella agri BL06]KRS21029.1 hypothetical protein AAY72_10730 [Alishewanella sp. WH16-1]